MTLEPGRRYYMTEVRYGKHRYTSDLHRDKDHAVDEVYKQDELDRAIGSERISEATLYSFTLDYEGPIVFERDCDDN